MLWSSVPQLRRHAAQRALPTWLAIAAMAAQFWLRPSIVRYVHELVVAAGGAAQAEVQADGCVQVGEIVLAA